MVNQTCALKKCVYVYGLFVYNRWFSGPEKRKKRREIYAARVHLIKHLVGLSDQSKRKTEKKNCYSSSSSLVYTTHNTLIPLVEIGPV